MIEVTNSFDKQQWDEFVRNHPHGNIFQTTDMAEVYRQTKNYDPVSLAAIDPNSGEMLAVLQAVVIREMGGLLGSFSARSVIQGGPLVVDGKEGVKAAAKLMEHYDDAVRKKVVYTQIRNMWDTQRIKNILEQRDYQFIEHFNALIDLNIPIEELWGQIKRDKKRGIKKANEIGIIIEICQMKSDVEAFYNLVKMTYDSSKIPLAHISLFESTFDILVPKKALFIFAKNESGEVIATQVALMDKDTIYAWYTGAIRESLKYHPGDYLIWYLLKYGNKHGYKTFDFGGGGGPIKNKSLREYKSRFGTNFKSYGRYEKIHSLPKSKIADAGFKLYKKLII